MDEEAGEFNSSQLFSPHSTESPEGWKYSKSARKMLNMIETLEANKHFSDLKKGEYVSCHPRESHPG